MWSYLLYADRGRRHGIVIRGWPPCKTNVHCLCHEHHDNDQHDFDQHDKHQNDNNNYLSGLKVTIMQAMIMNWAQHSIVLVWMLLRIIIIITLYHSFYPLVWSGCFRLGDAVGRGAQKWMIILLLIMIITILSWWYYIFPNKCCKKNHLIIHSIIKS